MNHCQHFVDIPKATHLLVRTDKASVQLCDACAEDLIAKGEDVREIKGYLWGLPIVYSKPGEKEGLLDAYFESAPVVEEEEEWPDVISE